MLAAVNLKPMFNLGFSEILIIGVLALILIGPKQLPDVARVLGRMMKEFKQATKDLSGGLLDMKEELKKPVQESIAAIADIENQVYRRGESFVEEITDLEKTQEILPAEEPHKRDS